MSFVVLNGLGPNVNHEELGERAEEEKREKRCLECGGEIEPGRRFLGALTCTAHAPYKEVHLP